MDFCNQFYVNLNESEKCLRERNVSAATSDKYRWNECCLNQRFENDMTQKWSNRFSVAHS